MNSSGASVLEKCVSALIQDQNRFELRLNMGGATKLQDLEFLRPIFFLDDKDNDSKDDNSSRGSFPNLRKLKIDLTGCEALTVLLI